MAHRRLVELMGKDFEVTVNDEERKKNFIEVFGTNSIKIRSPIPERIIKPDGTIALAYFLDLELITEEQREKLILNLSKRFNEPLDFVRTNLDAIGVPILKEHCSLWIHNPQRWFD